MMFYFEPYRSSNKHALGKFNHKGSIKPNTWRHTWNIHCVQKKNTHSHFLSYLHELFVDLNKNCSEYTQGLIDSENVKIRYS